MRILMLTNSFPPTLNGVASSLERLINGLVERGHSVAVITKEQSQDYSPRGLLFVRAMHTAPYENVLLGQQKDKLDEYVESFAPEVIHSHFPFSIGRLAFSHARRLRIPIIFTYHTRYEFHVHHHLKSSAIPLWLARFYARIFALYYANLCDVVVSPSKSFANILKKGGVKRPITVIPTGIPMEMFSPIDGEKCKLNLGIPSDAFFAGYVGRLEPEKSVRELFEIFCELIDSSPRFFALMLGEGTLKEYLSDKILERRISDRFVMGAASDLKSLRGYYGAIDLLVHLSQIETQGLAVVEAMAHGRPILAIHSPGVMDVIRDRDNGILVHGLESRCLVDRVKYFMSMDCDARNKYGESAKKAARKFRVDLMIDKYERTYHDSVQRKNSSKIRRQAEEWPLRVLGIFERLGYRL